MAGIKMFRGIWLRSYWTLCSEIISCNEVTPVEVAEWYRKELDIELPKVSGKLLDLELVKSKLNFYRQIGFSPYEFGEMIFSNPHILDLEHDANARENLRYVLELGINSFALSSTLIHFPNLLTLSLEAHLKPRIDFYKEKLLLDINGLRKVFEQCPEFIQYSIVKEIRPRLSYFLKTGLSMEELSSCVVLQCPEVLGSTFHSKLKPNCEFLRQKVGTNVLYVVLCDFPNFMHLSLELQLTPFINYFLLELNMGRRNLSQLIKTKPSALNLNVERDIKPKIKYLKSLGLEHLHIFKIIVVSPNILKKSLQEGILKKVEEFREMGIPLETITKLLVTCPKYFSSSCFPPHKSQFIILQKSTLFDVANKLKHYVFDVYIETKEEI